ncbi:hypothetical protein A5678_10115 [Mycobacterium sp. E2733]|nr:hypothetical protein A5678_10115 [Mycobacterium sp. E2733]
MALLAALFVTCPPLARMVHEHPVGMLPDNAPSSVAARQMSKAFHESGSDNLLLIVLTDEKGLGPSDEDVYRTLVDKLRQDARDVVMMQDFLSAPPMREVMTSKDQKAWFLPIGLAGGLGSPQADEAYKHVAETVRQTAAGSTLTANLTGPAATIADASYVGERDMRVIEIATALLVLLILLIVYRNPVTMLLPLVTIGVSLVAAQRIVAGLSQHGLGISQPTIIFMTAMMAGAGTDYAVFLISRYHDYLRRGVDSDRAVRGALSSIGKVITASAATVAVTFLCMKFARLEMLSTSGPALAISIGVAFVAAMTLLPAILTLAGRRGWVAPRRDLTSRFWRRSGERIVRRPRAHLVGSLILLIILAVCGTLVRFNWDQSKTVPDSAESNRGYAALSRHFPLSSTVPEYLVVQSPHDLRSPKALADLEQMAHRVSQLPNVASVRGITRPSGQPPEQASVAYQAGEVGGKLQDTASMINDHTGDLDQLAAGANQLADRLAQVRAGVDQAASTANGALNALSDPRIQDIRTQLQRLSQDGTLDRITQLAGQLPPTQETQSIESMLSGLRARLNTAISDIQSLGLNDLGAARGRLAALQHGADALADGSRQLADGVQRLVDQTKRMGSGLSEASKFLLSLKNDASDPAMSGFYIPPEILAGNDFKKASQVFVSPDGHTVRYLVQTKLNPFSTQAMDQVSTIANTARSAQVNTALSDAKISMVGFPAANRDLRDFYNHDLGFIIIATILVVLLILIALLRALVAPLYLICSVVVSYLSALGIGVIVFQMIMGQQLSWSVPGMAFIVLVAVGADYNMLLISGIRDESSRHGMQAGVIRTVGSTGGVITSAGVIFAASMFGLLFGDLVGLLQAGFIIGAGLLLDTFVVRTITVPALAVLMGERNWWPHLRRRARSSSVQRAEPVPALGDRDTTPMPVAGSNSPPPAEPVPEPNGGTVENGADEDHGRVPVHPAAPTDLRRPGRRLRRLTRYLTGAGTFSGNGHDAGRTQPTDSHESPPVRKGLSGNGRRAHWTARPVMELPALDGDGDVTMRGRWKTSEDAAITESAETTSARWLASRH